MYGLIAIGCFSVVSMVLRSGFIVLLGLVAAFYLVSIKSPDGKVNLNAPAADKMVSMLVEKSNCAAQGVGEIRNVGQIIRNGDVLEIAKTCGLMP